MVDKRSQKEESIESVCRKNKREFRTIKRRSYGILKQLKQEETYQMTRIKEKKGNIFLMERWLQNFNHIIETFEKNLRHNS